MGATVPVKLCVTVVIDHDIFIHYARFGECSVLPFWKIRDEKAFFLETLTP